MVCHSLRCGRALFRASHHRGQIVFGTLPHIWSCFLPVIFNSYKLEFEPGTFDWPMTERHSFKTVNVVDKVVTLAVDDVWRLFEMTVLLGAIIPWTYARLFKSNWPLGIKLHLIGGGR